MFEIPLDKRNPAIAVATVIDPMNLSMGRLSACASGARTGFCGFPDD